MHLTEPMPLVNLESDMPIANRSESALLLLLKNEGFQLFEWSPGSLQPTDYPLQGHPPEKRLFVRQGRATVGQCYLTCMANAVTSNAEFLELCASQNVHAIMHVQTEKYYERLLQGTVKGSASSRLQFETNGFQQAQAGASGSQGLRGRTRARKLRQKERAPKQPRLVLLVSPRSKKRSSAEVMPSQAHPDASSAASFSAQPAPVAEAAEASGDVVPGPVSAASAPPPAKPKRKAIAPRNTSQHAPRAPVAFKLHESFRWGCVSFKYKRPPKPPKKSNAAAGVGFDDDDDFIPWPSYQVDCLRSDHHIHYANGSRTTCSKTLSFDPEDEESKDECIRRLKTWVLEGLDLQSRAEHKEKSRNLGNRPIDELMKDAELQARAHSPPKSWGCSFTRFRRARECKGQSEGICQGYVQGDQSKGKRKSQGQGSCSCSRV